MEKNLFLGSRMFLSKVLSGFKAAMLKIWAVGLGLEGRERTGGAEGKRKLNT